MLLEIKNLNKEYKRGSRTFLAVKDIDLSVSPGDFFCIIGKSGSGKSTLLNLIAGLLLPTSGEILIDGKNIVSLKDNAASYLRNSAIGYISQGQSVLANLSVLDNVRLPFYFFKRDGDAKKKALLLLEQVGIGHLADSYPRYLSGGELRRVAIARSLINNPSILLADEPTSDLDTKTTAETLKLFSEIAKDGTSVLLVTHELDTISYGNSVYVMDTGMLNKQ